MSFDVLRNRTPASTIIATPMAMKAKPATLANVWLWALSCRRDNCGAATWRNRSNRSMTKPNAITAIAVRTQARKVRSLAA
jgi:hypothetical protein